MWLRTPTEGIQGIIFHKQDHLQLDKTIQYKNTHSELKTKYIYAEGKSNYTRYIETCKFTCYMYSSYSEIQHPREASPLGK